VGENEDDDEKNEGARAGEPREQLHGYACLRRRHRAFTLPGSPACVKGKPNKNFGEPALRDDCVTPP
jgi:hypothetical protein